MPKESTPVCFRVSDDDRVKLEAAASYLGESLSAFVRQAALRSAEEVMKDGGGVGAVVERYDEIRRRRALFASKDVR